MPSYQTSLNTWGANGEEPPTNYSYEEGEQPVDAWDNWFNSNVVNDIEHLVNLTNGQLDSSYGSSRPSSPEDGEQFYNTGNGSLDWWNHVDTTWEEAFPKSGGTISGDTNIDGDLSVRGAEFPNEYFDRVVNGTVAEGERISLGTVTIPDEHRVLITQASLSADGVTEPAAEDLKIVLMEQTNVALHDRGEPLVGDGETMFINESEPNDGNWFEHNAGSTVEMSIVVRNDSDGGGELPAHAEVTGLVEPWSPF